MYLARVTVHKRTFGVETMIGEKETRMDLGAKKKLVIERKLMSVEQNELETTTSGKADGEAKGRPLWLLVPFSDRRTG